MRVTVRTDEPDSDSDFMTYVRHRAKRFYLGGFKPSITEDKIASYVSIRGSKVSKVTIFRNRKHSTVVIRLNVSEDADSILDPYFWPRQVTCRPWITRNQYTRN